MKNPHISTTMDLQSGIPGRRMLNNDLKRLTEIHLGAFESIGVSCTRHRARKLASVVQHAMSAHGRNYHNLDHVFSFVDPEDPISTLAGLYHDAVYYQVDQGFTPEILAIIIPYIYDQLSID